MTIDAIEARGPQVGWVCGYGSLARLTAPVRTDGRLVRPVWGRLADHRRDWGVAMDNRASVSDPKHYVHAGTERRYAGHVGFLDVVPERGAALGALAIPVDEERLAALEAREVNYDRHDVSDLFAAADGSSIGPVVWTFRGTADGRARATAAAARGRLAVSRRYVDDVVAAFAAQPPGLPAFARSTVPYACPVLDLDLVARGDLLGY